MNDYGKIISHSEKDQNFLDAAKALKNKIIKNNDLAYASVEEQLDILDQLGKFDFGRFLIKNKGGWNGYWTHYALTFPETGRLTNKSNNGRDLTELESFMLNKAPIALATQQRFKIFLKENNLCVKEGATLASIPCGLLGELLLLDYKDIKNINILGIDLDKNSLIEAEKLAGSLELKKHTRTILSDAWNLPFSDEFDLLSSNGLNIYESDKNKILKLYANFYNALKENGKLVTSYIGYPPASDEESEWDFDNINQEDLRRSLTIFASVLGAIWRNFTTKDQMIAMLESIGFKDIEIKYDNARIFPTVVAYKRKDKNCNIYP